MMNKSRPVVIIFSILAGLQILTSAGGLSDILGPKIFFLFGLFVASIQVGMTFFVQNTVVPQQDVGAYTNSEGKLVAGPASGVTNGKEVEVIKTEPPASEGEGTPSAFSRPDRGEVPTRTIAILAAVGVVILLLLALLY